MNSRNNSNPTFYSASHRLGDGDLKSRVNHVALLKQEGLVDMRLGYNGPVGDDRYQFVCYPSNSKGLDAGDKSAIAELYAHLSETFFNGASGHLLSIHPSARLGRVTMTVDSVGRDLLLDQMERQPAKPITR